jgi:hypothetical protein
MTSRLSTSLNSKLCSLSVPTPDGLHICPRTCPQVQGRPGSSTQSGLTRPVGNARKGYIALNSGLKRTCIVLRFRKGRMHSLPIHHRNVPVGQERLCQCCDSGALEYERHVLLECSALQRIRDRYAYLFALPRSEKMFMWQADLHGVACFVCERMRLQD